MTNKHHQTILVVEDETYLQNVLRDSLHAAGFEVLLARNGKAGLAMARKKRPDLIVLDIVMPKMDGLAMLTELRADKDLARTKVIILTNLLEDHAAVQNVSDIPVKYFVKNTSSIKKVVQEVQAQLKGK